MGGKQTDDTRNLCTGVESVQHVLPLIKKDADRIASKVSLTVSIYGIKAMASFFVSANAMECSH